MEDQILEFLAQGLGKEATIQTVGCTEEYFNSVLKSDGFGTKLTARAQELTAERVNFRYSKLEDKVLKNMEGRLDEFDANGLCKILDTAARHRQQQNGGNPSGHLHANIAGVAMLVMPVQLQETKVVTNERNEVVAIGNRNMSPMPLDGVRSMFAKFKDAKAQVLKDLNESQGETYENASVA